MAVESNIIFSIGSKMGPGGLASLQAGVTMVMQLGKAVINAMKETDKFTQVYRNLSISVTEADQATKGLIDTTELMINANKFQQAGFTITEKQLANVAKLAANFAQKTGGDATQAMNDLTKALTTGRVSGLRKYGVDIKTTTDLQKLFSDSMEQVEDKSKDLNIQLQTVSETFFAIKNNVDTAAGNLNTMFGAMSDGTGPLNMVNNALSKMNTELDDMLQTMDTMGAEFAGLDNIAAGVVKEVDIAIFGMLSKIPGAIGESFKKDLAFATHNVQKELERFRKDEDAQRARTGGRGSLDLGIGEGGGAPVLPPAPGGGGRGGGRRGPQEIEFAGLGGFDDGGILEQEQAEAELGRQLIEQQIIKNDLRSEEISLQGQMRDIALEMQELGAAGIETGALQSDFGLAATEENNELKQSKLDLISQELDLLREMNQEKLDGLESQTKKEKDLQKRQTFGHAMNKKAFNILGRTSGAYFDSVISGAAMSADAAKNMIADLSKQEAVYYAIQAVVKTGEGLYNAISPYGDKGTATAAFIAAGKYAAGAAAFGALSAALGGGKGGGASAPSAAAPGASGAPVETASQPSAGGGEGSGGPQEITVILQGDADRLFEVIREENIDRKRHSLASLEE